MEEWKNYPFDTRYQVSSYGNIKGQKGNILKGSINNAGYKRIGLYSNGKAVFKFVHRMVMETFSPCANSDDLIVNHKDGNKLNNHVDNLEWATSSENMLHAYQTGLEIGTKGCDHPESKLTESDVKFIKEHYIPRDKIYGARALGKMFGVSHSTVSKIINNLSYLNAG